MSTDKIYAASINILQRVRIEGDISHLDIGAGSGELIRRLGETNEHIHSKACDYTDSLMQVPGVSVDIVNLNTDSLPYQDGQFDLVTATEVIEHLENPRRFLRDIYRVLKPGGVCVLSTPNVLNLNSRLRFLWFGFAELFGPLPIGDRTIESTAGHISPISYFYLNHSMREAGFIDISLDVYKFQRRGIVKLVFLFVPIWLRSLFLKRREVRRFNTIDDSNREVINEINSIKVLLGRTLIVSARKIET